MVSKKTHLESQEKRLDVQLLLTVAVLVSFGLLMVYDSSAIQGLRDFKDSLYYIRQQLVWVVVGGISMLFFAHFNYKKFKGLAVPFFLFSLLLLLAVFIPGLGVSGGGAQPWLRLGMFTVQPA